MQVYRRVRETLIYCQYILYAYEVYEINREIAVLNSFQFDGRNAGQIFELITRIVNRLRELREMIENLHLKKWQQREIYTHENLVIGSLDELFSSDIYARMGEWRCDPTMANLQPPINVPDQVQSWFGAMAEILLRVFHVNNAMWEHLPSQGTRCEIVAELTRLFNSSFIVVKQPEQIITKVLPTSGNR